MTPPDVLAVVGEGVAVEPLFAPRSPSFDDGDDASSVYSPPSPEYADSVGGWSPVASPQFVPASPPLSPTSPGYGYGFSSTSPGYGGGGHGGAGDGSSIAGAWQGDHQEGTFTPTSPQYAPTPGDGRGGDDVGGSFNPTSPPYAPAPGDGRGGDDVEGTFTPTSPPYAPTRPA